MPEQYVRVIFGTIFARSDPAATIYFITQFFGGFYLKAATIRERLLFESGVY